MDKKFYLVKRLSSKPGKEPFEYVQLVCDLGYTNLVVSMDKNVIAELLGVAVQVLYQKTKIDEPLFVGSFLTES